MSQEPKFKIASGFSGGLSVVINADSYGELLALAQEAYGDDEGSAFVNAALNTLTPIIDGPVKAASAVIQGTLGGTPYTPGAIPPAPGSGTPPTAPYPGDCPHGVRVYVDKPARGASWKRWECAVPWSKDAVGRCKPVNV